MPGSRPILAALVLTCISLATSAKALDAGRLDAAVRAEETSLSARIGAAVLDTGAGDEWGYHAQERFPFDSTFKAFACAALLAKADRGDLSLDTRVEIEKSELLDYAPIASKASGPMSLGELCEAAIEFSDNTAANLVLNAIGGPPAVTAYLHTLGDGVSRLDRREVELNEATPGDPRDTTTPASALADLRKILFGDALSPASRARLTTWMEADKVSGPLLRAGLPPDWRVADKTGSGGHGSRGIVAAIWPPGRAPLLVAVYLTDTVAPIESRNATIARIGAAIAQAVTAGR